uniref:Uncharacterized protein n=1 Tax=Bracon brevicornis TaxID=1563983 RepID=A0A6V7L490_9HYME
MNKSASSGKQQQQQHNTEQDNDSSSRGSRIPSINSPASPLLLNVPGSGASYSNNHRYTNNSRTSNNTNDYQQQQQPLSPNNNHTVNSNRPGIDSGTPNSPSMGSNDPMLPLELPKLVHETSI